MSTKEITPEILEKIKADLKKRKVRIPKEWTAKEDQILDQILTTLYSGKNITDSARIISINKSTLENFVSRCKALLETYGIKIDNKSAQEHRRKGPGKYY